MNRANWAHLWFANLGQTALRKLGLATKPRSREVTWVHLLCFLFFAI